MNYTLDKWDIRFIKLCKSLDCTIQKAETLWAERCAFDPEDVELRWTNEYLVELAHKLGLFKISGYRSLVSFINSLHPSENYAYIGRNRGIKIDTTDMDLIVFSRITSFFALTEVKDLPGYV